MQRPCFVNQAMARSSEKRLRLRDDRRKLLAIITLYESRRNRCDAAPTPTGLAEIVSDDFPILHL